MTILPPLSPKFASEAQRVLANFRIGTLAGGIDVVCPHNGATVLELLFLRVQILAIIPVSDWLITFANFGIGTLLAGRSFWLVNRRGELQGTAAQITSARNSTTRRKP
jgi:hypothetical protein